VGGHSLRNANPNGFGERDPRAGGASYGSSRPKGWPAPGQGLDDPRSPDPPPSSGNTASPWAHWFRSARAATTAHSWMGGRKNQMIERESKVSILRMYGAEIFHV